MTEEQRPAALDFSRPEREGLWLTVPLRHLPEADRPKLKIGPILPLRRQELTTEVYGIKRRVRWRKGAQIITERDVANQERLGRLLAAEAIQDAERFHVIPGRFAERLSKALGRPVADDQPFTLDGALSDEKVRRCFVDMIYESTSDLVRWINDRSAEQSKALDEEAAEEEDELSKTSPTG